MRDTVILTPIALGLLAAAGGGDLKFADRPSYLMYEHVAHIITIGIIGHLVALMRRDIDVHNTPAGRFRKIGLSHEEV